MPAVDAVHIYARQTEAHTDHRPDEAKDSGEENVPHEAGSCIRNMQPMNRSLDREGVLSDLYNVWQPLFKISDQDQYNNVT